MTSRKYKPPPRRITTPIEVRNEFPKLTTYRFDVMYGNVPEGFMLVDVEESDVQPICTVFHSFNKYGANIHLFDTNTDAHKWARARVRRVKNDINAIITDEELDVISVEKYKRAPHRKLNKKKTPLNGK